MTIRFSPALLAFVFAPLFFAHCSSETSEASKGDAGSPSAGAGNATGGVSGAAGSAAGSTGTGGSVSSTGGGGGVGVGGSSAGSGTSGTGSGGGGASSGAAGTSETGGGGTSSGVGGGGGAGGSGVGGSGTGGSSGGAAGCDAEVSRENRDLVGKALDELFVQKDVGAIDRYWADPYLQHNPIATSGVATFRSVMSSIVASSSFSYQRLRTLGECDLVVVQGRYSTSGVIFDMLRVANKKIVEHWDSDSNQASESAGSTAVVDGQPTAQNRARVLALIDAVLVSGQTARAADFIAANHVEHRGNGGTGPQAFLAYVNADDIRYSTVHHVIADNNFVFTLSEGELGGTAYGFYDLFRLDGGSVVEHWDSRRRVPSTTASGLPIF